MSDDHPFRQPLQENGIVLRLPTWREADALMAMWDHPTLAWMFPDAFDGSWPDPLLLLEMASGALNRENVLVVENEHGELVGTVHLNGFDRGTPALGWYVAPDHRRQGIATRAVAAAMRHLFVDHCDDLEAYMDPRNVACRGLLEKLGFAPAASPRPDVVAFAITREDHDERLGAGAPAMRPAA
ncbi:GNAT family N-acetyltransferase [Methylobacterium brachiatum]